MPEICDIIRGVYLDHPYLVPTPVLNFLDKDLFCSDDIVDRIIVEGEKESFFIKELDERIRNYFGV